MSVKKTVSTKWLLLSATAEAENLIEKKTPTKNNDYEKKLWEFKVSFTKFVKSD